jgi:glycerol-1-phosphate dehydrogenase [NAD(P)+]
MAKQIDYHVSYGTGISNELVNICMGKKVLLVTDNLLWSKYGRIFKKLNPILVMTKTMEAIVLEEENKNLPDFDITIGLGGGMALDIAKFHAWKSQKTLYQVPTAISMDAMFSYPIALRFEGKVKYVGEIIPENIYCDFSILNSAPPIMNRSGICDLLSCHTALYDWKLGVNKGLGKMDYALFEKTVGILNQVKDNVSEIYDVTEKGIRMMMEGYKFVAVENYRVGHCQYEEGSEHFFYYCLESITQKHYLHGKVINLGILLMSMLQENKVEEIKILIKKAGVPIHPSSMDIGYEDIEMALRKCNDYVVEKGYSYSILNEKAITEDFIQEALHTLKSEFDPTIQVK